ncbi:MAG: ATPase [Candidatus Magnetoglobus multicellularis str. Araruama]|uniref:ATPase n=1 Tax=Candidatus Magnetoglobus multicellularis str. Araruama TaxID=890399 RepID=A0A1V1NYZ9_9BACT|nr:MAG: ATPase [Candidatus Magnetoglobus multicellularis str. Araruama]
MFGLMKKIFTEYKEPLYGRLTGQINLKPFSPIIEKEILDDLGIYTPENLLKFHIIFGGIPRYYDLLSDRIHSIRTPMDAIKQLIVSPYSLLKDEGKAVLMEEFGKKFMVYFSILQAISSGYHTRNQISGALGLNCNQLSPYLNSLEKHHELIERRTPIFSNKAQSKTSTFYIRDNFLSFWFRYLHKYSRLLEIEAYDRLNKIIINDFNVYEGTGFESLVTKLLIDLNGHSNWQFSFDDIGRYWDRKNREIDIIFINHTEKYIFFGECKINGNRVNSNMWQTLSKKSHHILQKFKDYEAVYGAFVVKNIEKALQKGWIYSLDDLLQLTH